jgi:hypothetical protein
MAIDNVTLGEVIDPDWGNTVANFINNFKTSSVATAQTAGGAFPVDLATVGPTVTAVTGSSALVIVSAMVGLASFAGKPVMGFAVSGATTIAASIDRAASWTDTTANALEWSSAVWVEHVTLTPGTNTFTAKYGNASCQFKDRSLTVIALI